MKNALVRQRKFTPLGMFLSVLELAVGQNNEGFHHALLSTWKNLGLKREEAPAKSSFSEAREKLSYHFFEEIFRSDIETQTKRQLWRGQHVYAVDGDQLDLPASRDLIEHGYRGYPTSDNRETHYPKMYTTHVYDVMGEQVREFAFSSTQDEVHMSRALIPALEKNSISIYDRLHSGYETMRAHIEYGSYFLIRARTNDDGDIGRGVYRQVRDFLVSQKSEDEITWRPQPGYRRTHPDLNVRVVKIKHPKTKHVYVFLTNLPRSFTRKQLGQLYRRRWEIETSFKDITCTLKLSQWHSKKLNGILQEIYALLWLVNAVKRQMRAVAGPKKLLKPNYTKPNFKLSAKCVIENLNLMIRGKLDQFYQVLNHLMLRTIERRKRDARTYPRQIRHRGREYKQANTIRRRAKPLTERH